MKRGAIIELTSLLDVILILMYLVLAAASSKADEARIKASEFDALNTRVKQLEEENEALSRKADVNSALRENCFVITLYVEKNNGSRMIVLENDALGTKNFDLTWENRLYARNALGADISQKVKKAFESGHQIVLIVFRYDRNEIYRKDYELVVSVVQTQKADSNVYYAEYDMGG